jgi:hypothetical protein
VVRVDSRTQLRVAIGIGRVVMDVRPLALAAVAAGLAVPAVVLAEGVGPHANGYSQHPRATKPGNDVSLVVHRDTSKADLYVNNFCLGSQGSGSSKYPNGAIARGVKASKGKIAYDGKATIYTADGQQTPRMKFAAAFNSKRAKGTVKFPGTQCGTIHFKAKLVQRTK